MSGIATAVVGSAVVSGYMSKKGADAQAEASRDASDAQVVANRENIEFQREIFEQQREDNAPWRELGQQSLELLHSRYMRGGYNPGDFNFDFNFEEDPGYQFRRQEGINALDASAAARGRLQSGAQARAVTRYGSDLASQEYNNAYNREFNTQATEYDSRVNRKNQLFNQLASMANIGQVANQQDQAARQNMASNVSQSTLNTGNALAQGAMNQGAARASGYQGMAQSANQGVQNYLMYNMMQGG